MRNFFSLSLRSSRNIFNDYVIGYNRPTKDRNEIVTEQKAFEWFQEDWQKARKRVAHYQLDNHLPSVYLSFILGYRRFNQHKEWFEWIKEGKFVHLCVDLGNSRTFRELPEVVTSLSDMFLKGDRSSESKRLGLQIAEIVRRGAE